VTADFASSNPVELAASLSVPFGTAGWLALLIHTIAIEFYVSMQCNLRPDGIKICLHGKQLRLTPAESGRLRQVSYERQLERGSTRPGYAGLTAERFGDANPYRPLTPVGEK
jgi:hypothetical protein